MSEMTKTSSKPHFVLIHGLGGGAWSWFKVKSLLDSYGYPATCLDLRGCGIDPTDAETVETFDDYNRPLEEFMAALPQNHKVVLVGYSAGGLSVTKALHSYPNKIQLVVYVAATMLRLGFQSPEDFKIGVPDFGNLGATAEHPPATFHPKLDESPPKQLPHSALEVFTLAKLLSRPVPLKPLLTKSDMAESSASDKVPRAYIKTVQDQVLKPDQQEAMIKKWPPSEVYAIDSDHIPLFTHPLLPSQLLLKAASAFT